MSFRAAVCARRAAGAGTDDGADGGAGDALGRAVGVAARASSPSGGRGIAGGFGASAAGSPARAGTLGAAQDGASTGAPSVARDAAEERPEIAALIRFIALTGSRAGEARALRWDWIDGPRAALPDSKTGPKAIWLGDTVRRLLGERPNSGDYVFARGAKPVSDATLWSQWNALRRNAGLDGVRLHDLRHGFASVAVGAGETLRTVAGLLGHSELAVTQGYAKFAEAPVREAADRVGAFLDASLKGSRRGVAKEAPGVSRDDARLVERYRSSRLSLRAFCATHDLDPTAFHRALRRVMAARAGGTS